MKRGPYSITGRRQMSEFADKLAALVAHEMSEATGDHDRMGVVIERIAASLGFGIALATGGDPRVIDTLIEGATAYAHAEAVQKAPLAAMISRRREK